MSGDLAHLWSDLLGVAMQLEPQALRLQILATQDDGLRAASYDGPSARSADTSSSVERMALNDRRDPTENDLRLLESLQATYVRAVAEIAVRSRSGRPCEDWDEAVHDHNLLDQMDAIGVLERIEGEKPSKWVHRVGDCLHDLELLARRHTARNPSRDERDWTDGLGDKDVCAWHLSVHRRYRRPRVPGKNICHDCAAVSELLGQKPPTWLIEAMIDHGDRPIAWRASLSRAMDELGIVREAG